MFFKGIDIKDQLEKISNRSKSGGDLLLTEAKRILKQDLFTENKILDHLKRYNASAAFADEACIAPELVYTLAEIKEICILYRLKFLDAKYLKENIPYEAILKIKVHNKTNNKNLQSFKVIAPIETFSKKNVPGGTLMFAKTNCDNYYLLHNWGKKLAWSRKLRFWHMRNFENLFGSIIALTFLITMSLPISLITLDPHAEYWSGYRAAAFFHLLIFNMGVTAYITFAFTKNFSSTIWNREHDFD